MTTLKTHLEYEYIIEYDFDKGWPGSREEPPEPPSVEVTALYRVLDDGTCENWVDILDTLNKAELDDLDQIVWSELESEAEKEQAAMEDYADSIAADQRLAEAYEQSLAEACKNHIHNKETVAQAERGKK